METNENLTAAAITDRGLNEKRPENEDSYLALETLGVFAVADGVGGAQAGDVASQMAMEILGEAFTHYGATVAPEEIMRVAIERANEAVFQMASDIPQLSSMATTVTALHISDSVATIANVGDSRVYRLDREGRLHRETDDHSVVEDAVRAGQMTPEQAAVHPNRNVISRAVGADQHIEVDVRSIDLEPGSTFLLCSDGITRHIEDSELQELLGTGLSVEAMCQMMKEICFDRGAEDNLTAIVVQIPRSADSDAQFPFGTSIEEKEEATVASARSSEEPFQASEDAEEAQRIEEPPPPGHSEQPDDRYHSTDEEAYLMEEKVAFDEFSIDGDDEAEPESSVKEEYVSSSVVVPAQEIHQPIPSEREFSLYSSAEKDNKAARSSSGGFIGRFFSTIVWLALGAALGIAGYYYWQEMNPIEDPVPPRLTEMKTANIPLTSFEETRRLIDNDPEAYANSAISATPEDAQDHYLLGRALMLIGKQYEAQRQFRDAKEKIDKVPVEEKATLRNEIEIAMSVTSLPTPAYNAIIQAMRETKGPVSSDANANSTDATDSAPSQPRTN